MMRSSVMAGHRSGHPVASRNAFVFLDGRVKPGHDEDDGESSSAIEFRYASGERAA
jgi:hypothetical protein